MERGLGIGGNYDSNLRLPWCCLYKTQIMAQQSSNNRAFVTSYRLEEKKKPEAEEFQSLEEALTGEKKEDPKLEDHSY